MTTEEIIAMEQQYVLQTYKRPPFVIERGEGVYLYDAEGRRYLDLVGGIAVNALGYSPPGVLAAIRDQAAKLIHVSNLYHTIPHAELAQLLVENSFADRVFFCNSGTEAVEGALKFARKWAKTNFSEDKVGIVAFNGSFHGRTFGALATTSREKYRKPFEPLLPGVTFAEFNDVDSARAAVNEKTCGVIVEPLQGEGGVNPAREDFLVALRELCDANDALLIFDEVQCGLGRTGTLWAHEPYGVQPDLMALAKPLGGGLPLGATLLTQRVADVITVGDHGSTFAANALICAVAQAVFRRLSDEGFLAGVQEKGDYLAAKLEALKEKHPCLVEVRGRGLIWGLELTVKAEGLIAQGYKEGLIVCSAGEKVLRLLPPLVVEKEHLDLAVEKLDSLLAQVQE
jgi:acetylornithine/N-succinyldiaminopimelate aminotransferase